MEKLFLLLLMSLVLYYIFYKRKEQLNNTENIKLDKKVRKLDNVNNIIKEVPSIIEDKPIVKNNNFKFKIHPYPRSSQDFIYVYGENEALLRSDYIDDAHNLMIGELRQKIPDNEFKRIQGNIKNQNVKNKIKLFNPAFYRFGQHYYNFQNINDHIIKPNYKIVANYLEPIKY